VAAAETALPRTTPHGLLAAVRVMRPRITNLDTGASWEWEPNVEQLGLWGLTHAHQYVLVAKPRKTGISTAAEWDDVQWTHACDVGGHRVRTVIAIDTDDKAKEHAQRLHDFVRACRFRRVGFDAHGVTFANGSRIDCMTAGGTEPGRGGDIHRLHVTELPFWRQPQRNFHALRSSCVRSAPILIETTMDPRDPFTEQLWSRARAGLSEWKAHFWRVSDHSAYRLDRQLTKEQWAFAVANGFTDRAAASWWIHYALAEICSGDIVALMHDFPQTEEHLWSVGEGRIISRTPPPAVVAGMLDVPGLRGDTWSAQLYGDAYLDPTTKRWVVSKIRHSGQVAIGVDTGRGVGKTNSVVVAIDKRDRRVLGALWSNVIDYDDLARVAGAMRDHFTVSPKWPATIIVEDDGIGDATCSACTRLGIPFLRFHQGGTKAGTQPNQQRCITATKTRVEAGMRGAPALLRDEVKRFRRDEKGQLVGPKDMIMALGIANVHVDEVPFTMTPDLRERLQQVHFADRLAEDRMLEGGKSPPWGH
jgi:hypothetical protein